MNKDKYGIVSTTVCWNPTGTQSQVRKDRTKVRYFTYHRILLTGRHKGKIMVTLPDSKRIIVTESAIRRYPKGDSQTP